MDIAESIYEVVVETSHTKTTKADANRDGHIRLKRGKSALSNNYSEMSKSTEGAKIHADHPKDRPKPTCLIHGPGHSSDECKVLRDFGSRYAKSRPTKYNGHNLANRNKFNRKKYNNYIVNSAVDDILLWGKQKLSAEKESHENIESNFDEIGLYQIDNMSLDDTKEKLELRKRMFE